MKNDLRLWWTLVNTAEQISGSNPLCSTKYGTDRHESVVEKDQEGMTCSLALNSVHRMLWCTPFLNQRETWPR
jgi:hypothetical protein